ncbi:TetR family transcriptional regulator [Alcaligenes sp. DN25]|uniref:TetR/AcrR family transcriptional regulator n=1 Tax=Alcaligenes TaxID=507 RepID=UPI00202DED19|nr:MULTISPECIES: TetR/AcrR family transcriptional regulator [Alcaligenes]URW83661.1 TetR family transcriptional regulator [Alcaligenes sp. DN25]WEA68497.1 TetR/AcrR family transcriptional regulator [Alcaligenes faecalis]
MARRTRAEMEETRATLLATARTFFAERGYADTSMDELTAQAGLTRGALYHHFGDKKGLLAAVVDQIDAEMDERLQAISNNAEDAWDGFVRRCHTYLEMALEPEMQRIVLCDAKAVLGGASPESHQYCVGSMEGLIQALMDQGRIEQADPHALASLIYGSLAEAAFWIAQGEDGDARLVKGLAALDLLLRGLLIKS